MKLDMDGRELVECPKCHTVNFRAFYKPRGDQAHKDKLEVAGYRCRNWACRHVEYLRGEIDVD